MQKAVQGSEIRVFLPIRKVDEAKRMVYGTLTAEVVDKSGEIFDYDSGKEAIQKWMDEQEKISGGKSKGNLREMHSNIAAGKFTDIVFNDDEKTIEGASYISDDSSWRKVLDGTLTGYSIGGGYAKRWNDEKDPSVKRYTPEITEVSLVDNPCVGVATFEVVKADGSVELRKFQTSAQEAQDIMDPKANEATVTPAAEQKLEQFWKANDGSYHAKKKDAIARNADLLTKSASQAADNAVTALDDAIAAQEAPPAEQVAPAAADAPAADPAAAQEPALTDSAAAASGSNSDGSGTEGGSDAPSGVADKAAPVQDLKKGLYDVARLANLIQELTWLQQSNAWEAEYEKDGSTVPAQLKEGIVAICEALKNMVAEETAELFPAEDVIEVIEKGISLDGLAKMLTGANAETLEKASKEQKAHLSAIADHHGAMQKCMDSIGKCLKAMGCDTDAATLKEDDGADSEVTKMAKAAGMTPDDLLARALAFEGLSKKFEAVAPAIETLTKRIEKVERVPAPSKGIVNTALVKRNGNEGISSPVDVVNQQLATGAYSPEQSNEMMAKALMADALQKPVKLT